MLRSARLFAVTSFLLLSISSASTSIGSQHWHDNKRHRNLASSENWFIWERFETANCSGSPIQFVMRPGCGGDDDATNYRECIPGGYSSDSGSAEVAHAYYRNDCIEDGTSAMRDAFGKDPYLRYDVYADTNCTEFEVTHVFAADSKCYNDYHSDESSEDLKKATPFSLKTISHKNGSISNLVYYTFDCIGDPDHDDFFSSEQLLAQECSDSMVVSDNSDPTISSHNSEDANAARSTKHIALSSLGLIAPILALLS